MNKKEKEMIIDKLKQKKAFIYCTDSYDEGIVEGLNRAINIVRSLNIKSSKESNFEHYASEILGEAQKHGLKNGFFTIYYNRSGVSKCDIVRVDDIINWLLKPYESPKNKGTKFEYDLLKTNDQSHDRKICSFATYVNMKNAGHFSGVHFDQTIKQALNNWEFTDEK